MDENRKFEIGYRLLIQQLLRDGIITNFAFKAQLDNASASLGIPHGEISDFAVLVAEDAMTELNSATPP